MERREAGGGESRLQARVRELEAALRKYGSHIGRCPTDDELSHDECHCGYKAALATPEPCGFGCNDKQYDVRCDTHRPSYHKPPTPEEPRPDHGTCKGAMPAPQRDASGRRMPRRPVRFR